MGLAVCLLAEDESQTHILDLGHLGRRGHDLRLARARDTSPSGKPSDDKGTISLMNVPPNLVGEDARHTPSKRLGPYQTVGSGGQGSGMHARACSLANPGQLISPRRRRPRESARFAAAARPMEAQMRGGSTTASEGGPRVRH